MTRLELRKKIASELTLLLERKVNPHSQPISNLVDIAEAHADDIVRVGRRKSVPRGSSKMDEVERNL